MPSGYLGKTTHINKQHEVIIMVEYKTHSESSEDRLTDQRKKEIDDYDDGHIFCFRNVYSDQEWEYITKTRSIFRNIGVSNKRSKL